MANKTITKTTNKANAKTTIQVTPATPKLTPDQIAALRAEQTAALIKAGLLVTDEMKAERSQRAKNAQSGRSQADRSASALKAHATIRANKAAAALRAQEIAEILKQAA
jgi:hypothetical protein